MGGHKARGLHAIAVRRNAAAREPGAGSQAQLALEGQQLLHEVEVGRYIRLPVPHHREGVVETQAPRVHQVGERHGHRARNSGQAVDQHHRACGPRFLCEFL